MPIVRPIGFAIGLIEGIAESVASLLKLFSGYVSDKFGNRKLPVFIGYGIAAITRPFLSFVTTWPQVLFVRTADRVGKGIRGAPRQLLPASSQHIVSAHPLFSPCTRDGRCPCKT